MSAEENQKLEDEEEYEDEDEDEEMYEEDEEDEDDDQVDFLGNLLANTLATPEGDTLCGTLVKISDTLETQNKIMIKLLTLLSKRAA